VLLGGALTLGVPLAEEQDQTAEIVVRVGYVTCEVPDFIDASSRLVKVEHQVPDFETDEGLGVDVEMNIPIAAERGFIFLRATSNHGFDPNPWTTTIGYTISIKDLLGILRPSSG
jgi:hypothetical protein